MHRGTGGHQESKKDRRTQGEEGWEDAGRGRIGGRRERKDRRMQGPKTGGRRERQDGRTQGKEGREDAGRGRTGGHREDSMPCLSQRTSTKIQCQSFSTDSQLNRQRETFIRLNLSLAEMVAHIRVLTSKPAWNTII